MAKTSSPESPDQAPARAPLDGRRRDPEASRAAILEAARDAFTEQGYARATIRGIARRAGVTHGLVMLHFTSKEKLFLAAVPGHRDLRDLVAGDRETLPERIAAGYVERMEGNPSGDPFVALLRSAATNETAAADLYTAMQAHSEAAYREVLTGDDMDIRVGMLAAQLIGVTFGRYIVRAGRLAEMSPEDLRVHLGRVLRDILFPANPGLPNGS
ncbi:TetR family transcriptional regulator [Streptomyces sp. NPDC047072]|uniref:TetR/AcrR family transcriptional regulator n=1 Tax=Streptomyces sp. NPDC047072 TaxID=3154809 RepID=UPI00340CDE45